LRKVADQNNTKSAIYVLTVEAVRRALNRLVATQSHEHLPGYLAILQAQNRNRGASAVPADIATFHERYLKIGGAPSESPYLRPFKSRGRGAELMNRNVAGSYSPASLREKGKLQEVVKVVGDKQNATYSLQPDHAMRALNQLLKGHKIPAASLAVFLLRDFGFSLEKPEFASVMKAFLEEFALTEGGFREDGIYDVLFEDDSSQYSAADLELLGNLK
jgi:hypothetical protein